LATTVVHCPEKATTSEKEVEMRTTPHFLTKSPKRMWIAAVLAATFFLGALSMAGDPPTEKNHAPYRYYFFFNLGAFDPEEDLGLLRGASGAFTLNLGIGHRLGRYFLGEVELGVAGRQHDVSPAVLPVEDDLTLMLSWLSYSVAARFPVGRFEPFVAAGIGSGRAEVEFTADDPFEDERLAIEDDRGPLFFYRAGFDAAVSPKNRIGLELRRIDFEADLGAFTEGETDVGGTTILLTWRYLLGRGSNTRP
jgi:hypothetical protein